MIPSAHAQGAVLKGIIPSYERKVRDILDSVKPCSAAPLDPSSPDKTSTATDNDESNALSAHVTASLPPILLGQDMANSLGANVGSLVTVTSPQGELTPFGIVSGYALFQSGRNFQFWFLRFR